MSRERSTYDRALDMLEARSRGVVELRRLLLKKGEPEADVDAAIERLRAAGARLLNEPRAGAGGHRYVFVHPASTGGVLLELIQESER